MTTDIGQPNNYVMAVIQTFWAWSSAQSNHSSHSTST